MLEPAFATVVMALCQYRYLALTRFKDAYVFCAILAIPHPEGRTASVDTDVNDYASCTLRMLRRLQIMVAIRECGPRSYCILCYKQNGVRGSDETDIVLARSATLYPSPSGS